MLYKSTFYLLIYLQNGEVMHIGPRYIVWWGDGSKKKTENYRKKRIIISKFMCKLRQIRFVTKSSKHQRENYNCFCRSWATFHWRWWNQWWCGRSWCCMPVTVRVMTTVLQWHSAGPEVPRDERLLCCRQCVGHGIRLWLAGRNPPLHSGWNTSWRSWLNVSTHTFVRRPNIYVLDL